jgi:hypothetical protein
MEAGKGTQAAKPRNGDLVSDEALARERRQEAFLRRVRFLRFDLPDPKTGRRTRHLLGPLEADPFARIDDLDFPLKVIGEQGRFLRSKLFTEIGGKAFLAAQLICRAAIIRYWHERDPAFIPTLDAPRLRKIHGMRGRVQAIIKKLREVNRTSKTVERVPLLHEIELSGCVEPAIELLQRFTERAKAEQSRADVRRLTRELAKKKWPFEVNGLAYALFTLLTKHSREGPVRAYEAYRRIGQFENDFLKRKIGDSSGDALETVRVQVRTFRRSRQRGSLDRVLNRLLAAEWVNLSGTDRTER